MESTTEAASLSIDAAINALVIPTCMVSVAPLPLPRILDPQSNALSHAQLEAAVRAVDAETALDEAVVRRLLVTGELPPLPPHVVAPPLDAQVRQRAAIRAAAGVGDGDASRAASQGVNRLGTPLEGDAQSWSLKAPFMLQELAQVLDRQKPRASLLASDPDRALRIVATVAPFRMYTPWSHPDAHAAAGGVLISLVGAAAQSCSASEAEGLVAEALAPALLAWADGETAAVGEATPDCGDPTRADTAAHVAAWTLSHLAAGDSAWSDPSVLRLSLALALRLTGSWEASTVWLGASCLWYVVMRAPRSDLQRAARLVHEAASRVALSRHATTLAIASALSPARLQALVGRAPALPPPVLGSPPSFTGAYDGEIEAMLRAVALAPSSEHQFAILTGAPLLLACMGSGAARHVAQLLRALEPAALDTADARLSVAALSSLRVLVILVPVRFVADNMPLFQGGLCDVLDMAADTQARADAMERTVCTAFQALVQASDGMFALPTAADREVDASFTRGSAGTMVGAATAVVRRFATALLDAATVCDSVGTSKALTYLQVASGVSASFVTDSMAMGGLPGCTASTSPATHYTCDGEAPRSANSKQ